MEAVNIKLDIKTEDALAATLLHIECLHVSDTPQMYYLNREMWLGGNIISAIFETDTFTRHHKLGFMWYTIDGYDVERHFKETKHIRNRVVFDLHSRESIDALQEMLRQARMYIGREYTHVLVPIYED